MKSRRVLLLISLLEFNNDINEICNELSQFDWDCSEDLIVLERSHALSVLERYLNNQITASDVEEWANAIEGREDIGFEKEYLHTFIYEMANPILTKPLSENTAKGWILKIISISHN